MESGGIYIIRLSDTHYYGGRAKRFKIRWAEHLRRLQQGSHRNHHMQAVFNLHGRFEPEVVMALEPDVDQTVLEQVWLDRHFGQPGCVNVSKDAKGRHGPMPPESRERMKEAWKHRAPITEDTRAKLSAAKKGIPKSVDHKQKISSANTGRHHTETSKRKMSESQRSRFAEGGTSHAHV